ncbi:MAG: Hpt domain-containing protein [Thiopseudomonas sp.]|nr:Hpt domain-containing protein [Thiopseudomonas sp.]MCK9464362.1 Hpt domain-containing protein [Thiopseudomonas sp.]
MGERHDYVALEWVKGEIAETLKQARQALEDYVENPEDSSRLSFCLTYIHQVHGTLQMVEFFGAALLAEEMEKLSQALLDNNVPNLNEALEVMMQAILQLPLYLERIQTARRDLPMVILPLLNDLRAARDEKLLSETSLFNPAQLPERQPLTQANLDQLDAQDLPALLRKLRQLQQVSLVGLLRNQDVERNLANMARVFSGLEKLSQNAPLQPLWQVALGLIEGLANKSLELSASVRTLLRQLDAELRKLVREQAAGLNQLPPVDLLKNLLFYVAKTNPNSTHLQELHELYRLTEALPSELLLDEERARMAGPDRGAMRSVVTALCEELVRIKDQLDLFVRSDRANLDELITLQQPLKQIADTLAVLGFAQPRKVILDQIEILQNVAQGVRTIDDGTLMDIAGALLYLEATLTGMVGNPEDNTGEQALIPTTDVSQIHRVVFKEARTGLEQAKDGIIAFIASQWKHEHLQSVPDVLNQVRGGLIMIPLQRAADLVDSCRRYVQNELIERQQIPNWQDLDTLADAITSVEYYLERLYEDHESEGESILDVAEESLASLGYKPIERAQTAELDIDETDEDIDLAELVQANAELSVEALEPELDDVLGEIEFTADLSSTEQQDVAEPEVESVVETKPKEVALADLMDLPEVELPQAAAPQLKSSEVAEELSIKQILATPSSALNPPSTQEVPLTLLPPPVDEEAPDEELLEIFVEEAEEVQETIATYYPQWCAELQDKHALSELRRSFHTLKGSGRMVRALVLGELAWSVENLLNRIIENTVESTPAAVKVVAEVIKLLPSLVEEFAQQQQRQRDDVDRLANIAHALARKLPHPDFLEQEEAQEFTADQQDVADRVTEDLEQHLAEFDLEENEYHAPLEDAEPAEDAEDSLKEVCLSESAAAALEKAGLEPALIDIFINEALNHLKVLVDFNKDCEKRVPRPVSDELQRSLHTLKGSAHMSGVEPVAAVVTPLEKLVKEYRAHLLTIDSTEAELLKEAEQLMRIGVQQLDSTPMQPIPGTDELIAKLHELLRDRLDIVSVSQDETAGIKSDPLLITQVMAEDLELLLSMDERINQWRTGALEFEVPVELFEELTELQNAAQMAEISAVTELCDAFLRVYIALDNGQIHTNDELYSCLEQGHLALVDRLDEVAATVKVHAQPEIIQSLMLLLEQQLESDDSLLVADLEPIADAVETAQTEPQEPIAESEPAPIAEPTAASVEYSEFDEEMAEIFLEEAMDLLESANKALEKWLQDTGNSTIMAALMRDLHTLKGGARMAEIKPIGDLAHELEFVYEGLLEGRLAINDDIAKLLHLAHDELAVQLEALQEQLPLQMPLAVIESLKNLRNGIGLESSKPSAEDELDAEAEKPLDDAARDLDAALDLEPDLDYDPQPQVQEQTPADAVLSSTGQDAVDFERDPELVEIFLEEGFEIIESVTASMQKWLENPENLVEVEALQRDLHTLKGGARMAEISEIGDLAHELEFLYEDFNEGKLKTNDNIIALLHRCHDRLANMLEDVRDNKPLSAGQLLIEQIRLLRENPDADLQSLSSTSAEKSTVTPASSETVDADLLEVFVVDAKEHLQQLTASIEKVATADPAERMSAIAQSLAVLTSLKSGAQLAQLPEVGQHCSQLEHSLSRCDENQSSIAEAQQGVQHLTEEITRLDALLTRLAPQKKLPVKPEKIQLMQQTIAAISAEEQQYVDDVIAKALPFVRKAQQDAEQLATQRTTQEQVRVPAELLEQLVNLAGETSIFRARVEQQVSDFAFTLSDMEATLDRVRDQLRRLDTETQAQIISRHQDEAGQEGYEDFDPLEMDQYSHLQQLSRSLFESASDLLDLKETLVSKTRDAETLLLQQSRVNTELQEGLMRTRMVPFERMLPRLRRIVRQVADELGKQVELKVANAEGEMDRSVLERMVAPLEHMLRNAIGHGIETAEVRAAAGKPAKGTIRLELSREGADILLVMSDDGTGINLAAVRKKAIERGLMTADSSLTDQEVMQFILKSGFSTAAKITQVSGRGVGMDVVASEIKQIGGSISIESATGLGTRFVIRLPFTVSVNRALMVLTGDDLYAVPLNVIEGIVRVSPYELEALYEQARTDGVPPQYEYAGQNYELRYIGELLVNGQQPKLVGQALPLPVILVRSEDHAIAVQVDALAGSREIVVKSLGPQFSSVYGISGATILGDGRVVVIVDLMATIRNLYARSSASLMLDAQNAEEKLRQKQLLVMIVDDSVTVRKVTSRLLERHGMAVMTAKDGMDAITQLQDRKPDVMLLDIEMPRMDGFEVATLVRHDQQFKDLPIIMITSRTGEKHRERAVAIGVNEYLGKPYQEAELLQKIEELTT